ncbi:MAG: tRNA uridine-5-carboxymethylaminomethyl(34) synthesis GTPase MnmE [Clostridia bacterium]
MLGHHFTEETIAAVATPPGRGGVAIVRISGPETLDIARRLLRRRDRGQLELSPRRIEVGFAVDTDNGEALDQVLCFYMPGPRSYTGEDVVEIHCHGGPVPVGRILETVFAAGARPAEPGEFTRRAFLNGRIDLTQAEAVGDLVAARSRTAARLAMDQLEGHLGGEVRRLRSELLDLLASIEVVLDYPEMDIEQRHMGDIIAAAERIGERLRDLRESAAVGRPFREGIRTVILGRPNVGKSSLLNALVGRERAIVTNVPGTTRDTVEEELILQGIPLILVDTAGIRESGDHVERLGVQRARDAARRAELILVVLDDSNGLTEEDRGIVSSLSEGPATVIVVNKTDLREGAVPIGQIREMMPDAPVVRTSALTGEGLDALGKKVAELVLGSGGAWGGESEGAVITSARHERAVAAAEQSVSAFVSALGGSMPVDVASIDLREAIERLGYITGESVTEDLLDNIFANFCVGK